LQLSVIIVNYNVQYFLEQCLVSVINACSNIDAEILVIDNCSTDGSKAFFEGRFNEVSFIWLTENIGFSRANNFALKQAKGEIILFLNPDTLLPGNCVEKCLHFYATQAGIGALGIHMVDGSGRYLKESKRGFPSPVTSFFKMSGLTKIFPASSYFARYYLGHLPENKTGEVDVLSGAFMMVSKKILDLTGGFDEVFFMYGEDIDLSYRIQKAGYKNFYFTDCSIIHFKGESTKKQTAKYIRTFYGAMSLFVKKHYSKAVAFLFTIVIEMAILIKQFIAAVKRLL
jgi:GT2 family glycosyltransferase